MQALTQATCSEPAVYGIVLWFLARRSSGCRHMSPQNM